MIIVKILTFILGAAFLLFGYFIYFRKRYHLINGFSADHREGRKSERYAKRVGLIEFILGAVLQFIGVLLLILT